jgi:ribosomal protein S18 acetylase RimI-like enzyme
MNVALRPEAREDDEFLRRLITQTIAGELGADQWPEPMRSQLLGLQYLNRRMGPRSAFPQGESFVMVADAHPAGWLFLADLDHEIHLVEIMVLPELRGKGVGSVAMRQVLARAATTGKPVGLTVNVLNAGAIRLYESLGFERTGGDEIQHRMEARP